MRTSEQINEIAKALSSMQGSMKPAVKDSKNPHFKSNYADLASVWEAIRPSLGSNNLTVWQDVITNDHSVCVITKVVHQSGQWIEFGPLCIPLVKFDAHAIGSAVSYGRRYSLCAALGVVSEDDDGNAASSNLPQESKRQEQTKQVITKEQADEIINILSETNDEVRHNVYTFINRSEINAKSLYELPVAYYKTVLNKATLSRDSIKKQSVQGV